MLTFSELTKSLNPETLFGFRKDDIFLEYDLNQEYGVNPTSSILSQTDDGQLIPRYVRVSQKNMDIDNNILFNQITENEFYNENDSSIYVGRNASDFNGMLYYNTRAEGSYNEDLELSVDSIYTDMWQLYVGKSDLKTRYKITDYDNNDDYAVVMIDSANASDSYVIKKNMNTRNGNIEIWQDKLLPKFIPPDTILQPDFRNIYIALINPRTGEIYDSYKFFFGRNGSLVKGSNCLPYTKTDSIYDVYEPPKNDPDYNVKPKIKNILTNYLGSSEVVKLIRNDPNGADIPIGPLDDIYVEVEYNRLPSRSYTLQNNTDGNEQTIMRYKHFDIKIDYVGVGFKVYNRYTGLVAFGRSMGSFDKSVLFCCKMSYEFAPDHNPQNNYYNFNYVYNFLVDDVKIDVIRIPYKGTRMNLKDRGIGEEIEAVPTFLNMPVMVGWQPFTRMDTRTDRYGKYVFKINNTDVELAHIKYMYYGVPSTLAYFDNFATFITNALKAYDDFNLFYYSTFNQDNTLYDRLLVNYWACDRLGLDIRSVPNKFVYSSSVYDVFSDMKLYGNGKFYHDKEVHRVLKDSIRFDGVTGLANLMNTWSSNGKMTINFWFKSTQKTKGVILCDMEHPVPSAKGIYIGISEGGFLEVALNDLSTKIYNTVDITDNNWHMITIIAAYNQSENLRFRVMIDGNFVDSYNAVIANKEYVKNYQVYFMGHPLGNMVKGSLARIGFYKDALDERTLKLIYAGDLEHHLRGTVLLQNMPYSTEIRAYNNRTGELVNRFMSDAETGKFLFRNYEDYDVYLLVMDFKNKFGNLQAIGLVEPKSLM